VDFQNAIEQAAQAARKRMLHRLQQEAHDLRASLKAVYKRDPAFLGYIQKQFRLQEGESAHLLHIERSRKAAQAWDGKVIDLDASSGSEGGAGGTSGGGNSGTLTPTRGGDTSGGARKRAYASKSVGSTKKARPAHTRTSSPGTPRTPSSGGSKTGRLERTRSLSPHNTTISGNSDARAPEKFAYTPNSF